MQSGFSFSFSLPAFPCVCCRASISIRAAIVIHKKKHGHLVSLVLRISIVSGDSSCVSRAFCKYICVHPHTHTHKHQHTHVQIYICVHTHTHTHKHQHTHVQIYIHVCVDNVLLICCYCVACINATILSRRYSADIIYIYTHTHTHIHTHMYVYMYIYIYIYRYQGDTLLM